MHMAQGVVASETRTPAPEICTASAKHRKYAQGPVREMHMTLAKHWKCALKSALEMRVAPETRTLALEMCTASAKHRKYAHGPVREMHVALTRHWIRADE